MALSAGIDVELPSERLLRHAPRRGAVRAAGRGGGRPSVPSGPRGEGGARVVRRALRRHRRRRGHRDRRGPRPGPSGRGPVDRAVDQRRDVAARAGIARRGARPVGGGHPPALRRLLLPRPLHPHRRRPGRRGGGRTDGPPPHRAAGADAPRGAVASATRSSTTSDDADVAVVFVGGRSGMSEDDTSGEFRDASDLRLPPEQLDLIEATATSGVPTVVVVIGGRAHSLTEVVPHAAALVMAWLPGDEGASGLVDVLAGDVDAGGRLPVSLLRTVGQVGAYAGHHHGGGRSLIYGDYIDGPVSPLFPFGHGLSYTTWSYDEVAVVAGSTTEDDTDRRRAHEHRRSPRRGGHPGLRARRGGLGRSTRPTPGRVPAGRRRSRRDRARSLHDPRHRARVPRRRPPVPGGAGRRHLPRRPDVHAR